MNFKFFDVKIFLAENYIARKSTNLSFGFLSSESSGIVDEFSFPFLQIIAEGAIFKGREKKNRRETLDSEGIKPKTQVTKPYAPSDRGSR